MTNPLNPKHHGAAVFGVIFDMDGVLIDSARPHLASWRQLASEHGAVVTDELFAATFGRQNRDIIPAIFGPVSPEQLVELADRKEAIYRDLIREKTPIVPGAIDLIEQLSAAAIPMAVGSSGPLANIEQVLAAMRSRSRIAVIVSAADVTRGKPDPLVFQLACTRLNMPAAQCVVIEDAPVGVEAAKAAGAKAVAVLMHHSRAAFATADWIVERLSDIRVATLQNLFR